jgi:hypothetical protein
MHYQIFVLIYKKQLFNWNITYKRKKYDTHPG